MAFLLKQMLVNNGRMKVDKLRLVNYILQVKLSYKLLNRCLAMNVLLSKIEIIPSPACSFCGEADESLEHIFVTCHYIKKFWAEVIKWVSNLGIEIQPLSDKDIMLGIMSCKRGLFVNHILLIAKKYIYSCRCNKTNPPHCSVKR